MAKSQLRIFFIRHGETEWALTGQHTGREDIALTTKGELEARQLGERIRDIEFHYVFMSPLLRATQTCLLAGLGGIATVDAGLIEWHNGDYEGKTHKEIEALQPGWNLFRDGCPNGESPSEILSRADALIDRLRKMNGNIALFSHGHFGRVLGARWIGQDIALGQYLLLNTVSLSILGYEHENESRPAIVLWNSSTLGAFST